ncbi:MAG: hypothetical protein A3G79_02105 [Gallionellales bacterium RIFCSPLOWO2_12_FULL_57_18]|nr:MAG: hypothetical protein A3G79_02105 [Gallionellales bacterium RIFCSPLOWO2_12_FULL_57_18]OGS97040.1 MAG: hypothetical protein A3H31_06020 [Gallionellales bacterium RIFCSPLOWO2_02_FULL_57_47]OGT15773.1 MAG: hypothetical protein A3J49_06310 [Gallionellales bacterium RIFCSPHIGHO2_02_FULL_57_16]
MRHGKLLIPAICLIFLFGCASKNKAGTDTTSGAAPASESAKSKAKSAKNSRVVKSKDGVEGEIVGTPAAKSKFAKLAIGMRQVQVEKLIGRPDDLSNHITGKQFRPFYFGGDTQRIEAYYKGEGQLTFSNTNNFSAPDTLIRIEANPKATGISE